MVYLLATGSRYSIFQLPHPGSVLLGILLSILVNPKSAIWARRVIAPPGPKTFSMEAVGAIQWNVPSTQSPQADTALPVVLLKVKDQKQIMIKIITIFLYLLQWGNHDNNLKSSKLLIEKTFFIFPELIILKSRVLILEFTFSRVMIFRQNAYVVGIRIETKIILINEKLPTGIRPGDLTSPCVTDWYLRLLGLVSISIHS